jgi:hypothetical protein
MGEMVEMVDKLQQEFHLESKRGCWPGTQHFLMAEGNSATKSILAAGCVLALRSKSVNLLPVD